MAGRERKTVPCFHVIHYDPHKWLDHFFDFRGSALKEILGRLALSVLWSIAVVAVHKYWTPVGIPSTIHSLVGVALGLLLVFRTNSSYDRYWEGRRLWGGIVNASRNLVRSASAHISDCESLLRLVNWTVAFPYAAMSMLRGAPSLGRAARDLPSGGAHLAPSHHLAMSVAAEITSCIRDAQRRSGFSDMILVSLEAHVKELVDHLGGCERIRKTPLPFAYVLHLRRALVLYCFTLPFALVESFGWTTVLDVLLVSYVFFGIEEIGVEIEGPFGFDANDLPLDDISDGIRGDLRALAGAEAVPAQPMPEGL